MRPYTVSGSLAPVNCPTLVSMAINRFIFDRRHTYYSGPGSRYEALGYLMEGSVEISSSRVRARAGVGDLIYIPRGEVYRSVWHAERRIEFYSLRYVLAQSGFGRDSQSSGHRYKLQTVTAPKRNIRDAFERLNRRWSASGVTDYPTLGEFYVLYGTLVDILEREPPDKRRADIWKAVECIENDPATDFRVSSLAALCGMGQSRFYAEFKERTGQTPVEYRNRIRIQLAMEMLADEDCTVESVSERLNFNSPGYFRRVFRKFAGTNPGEARRRPRIL